MLYLDWLSPQKVMAPETNPSRARERALDTLMVASWVGIASLCASVFIEVAVLLSIINVTISQCLIGMDTANKLWSAMMGVHIYMGHLPDAVGELRVVASASYNTVTLLAQRLLAAVAIIQLGEAAQGGVTTTDGVLFRLV